MSTYTDSRPRADTRRPGAFPAYGPVDAVLGFLLFYFLAGRATPTIVDVVTDATAISPSAVRLGLALFVWFVLAVTVLDQARRQLGALGVVEDDGSRTRVLDRIAPTEVQLLGATVLVLVFGLLAAWTFESAVETAVTMIRVVATLDAGAFVLGEFVTMVVFFVSFAVASQALDRLVVDGLRALLAGEPGHAA
jgi:hypothetical protein